MTRISIIMPVYNVSPWIEDTLRSVIAQTFTDWECMIVDDGSTDDTAAKVRCFHDKRIRLISQRHAGVSAARNTGLNFSKGELITFLDGDDIWHPCALERLKAPLLANSQIVLSWADFVRFDDSTHKEIPLPGTRLWHSGDIWADLLVDNFMQFGAICVRADCAKKFKFNNHLHVGEDRDWLLRILKGQKAQHVPHVVHYYRRRQGSAMQNIQTTINDMAKMMATHLADPDVPLPVRNKSLSLLAFQRGVLLAKTQGQLGAVVLQFACAVYHAPLFLENYLRVIRKLCFKFFPSRDVRLPREISSEGKTQPDR